MDETRLRLAKEYLKVQIRSKFCRILLSSDVGFDPPLCKHTFRTRAQVVEQENGPVGGGGRSRLVHSGCDCAPPAAGREVAEARGWHCRPVADALAARGAAAVTSRLLRGHKLPVTAIALAGDAMTLFSSFKDGSVLQWDVEVVYISRLTPVKILFRLRLQKFPPA